MLTYIAIPMEDMYNFVVSLYTGFLAVQHQIRFSRSWTRCSLKLSLSPSLHLYIWVPLLGTATLSFVNKHRQKSESVSFIWDFQINRKSVFGIFFLSCAKISSIINQSRLDFIEDLASLQHDTVYLNVKGAFFLKLLHTRVAFNCNMKWIPW